MTGWMRMTLKDTLALKDGDEIDLRDKYGPFSSGKICKKKGNEVTIHYDGYHEDWDEVSNLETECYKFAKAKSISRRAPHRSIDPELKSNDCVLVNAHGWPGMTGSKWIKGKATS